MADDNKMLTIARAGSPKDFEDNPLRGAPMDYTTDREFHPNIMQRQDWRIIAVKTACALVSLIVVWIVFSIWKWVYCMDGTRFSTCVNIDIWTPRVVAFVVLVGVVLVAWQWIEKQMNMRRIERAVANTANYKLDRFGNHMPADLFERMCDQLAVQFYATQYAMSTTLKERTAQYEKYSSVNTLNEAAQNVVNTDLNVAPQLEAPKPALPMDGMSIEQMVSAGYVRGSDYSLLLGLDDKSIPVLWNWSPDGTSGESVAAIAGAPGMGKTYAAKLILAVAAYKAIRLALCDPQGEGNNKQTLLYDARELKDAFFVSPAIEDRDILISIAKVYKVMENRMKGHDKSIDPILLVIDEFSYLMTMNEHAIKIVDMLTQIGRMGRKYNVRVLLIGQSWRSDVVGGERGTTLRNLIRLKMIFGIDPMEVRFLTSAMPQSDLASIAGLNTGHALVYSKAGAVLVTIPTTQNDLMAWAGRNIGKMGVHSSQAVSVAPDTFLEGLLATQPMDYAMAETPENGQNGLSVHSIAHSVDVEELARELFAANLTQREVGDRIRARGLKIDHREMPRLQRDALKK